MCSRAIRAARRRETSTTPLGAMARDVIDLDGYAIRRPAGTAVVVPRAAITLCRLFHEPRDCIGAFAESTHESLFSSLADSGRVY